MSEADHAIVEIASVDARIAPFDWPFSRERRDDIDRNWEKEIAAKPKMFNGRVLLQHRGEIEGDAFVARYFETDYADFLGWIRLGYPGVALRNGFSMAALRARDGAFLLGEMAAHTVNAGRIYFAAGTPDLNDVDPDGVVDLGRSAVRELGEETGLLPHEIRFESGWALAFETWRVAFMRPCRIDLPAAEARRLMLDRIRQQDEPELADIRIVRSLDDCPEDCSPEFMRRYLAWAFARD